MAYMNQERKARIAHALKAVIPKGWKYSLAVQNHSTIVLTIAAAPVDLLGQMQAVSAERAREGGREDYLAGATHIAPNPYYWRESGLDVGVWEPILAALNDGNHDRSDPMTDYFDVGWYVEVNIGQWNRPFVNLAAEPQQVAA
jgi:hypothetical protein